MSGGGVTVIGLTPGTFLIEDIRVTVPYREAVQIPSHLVQRSRNLGEALHQQRIMQLGNALPVAPARLPKPTLAPSLRGRGIAPHLPVSTTQAATPTWPEEREVLLQQLEASRAQGAQLQGMNESLQSTLESMSGQLQEIQATLSGMSLAAPAEGTRATAPKARADESLLEDSIPHFIPPTAQEAAEVRIAIPEKTSDSDLSGARGALRSLRGKPGP